MGCCKVNNIKENSCHLATSNGINNACYQYSFPQRFGDAFTFEMERFRNVLNNEESPFVTCIDACRATQIAEACRLSVVHKIPVDIEYDMDNPSRCQYTSNNRLLAKTDWDSQKVLKAFFVVVVF